MKRFILNILVNVIDCFNNIRYPKKKMDLEKERAKAEVYSKGDSISYLYHNTYKLNRKCEIPMWEYTDPSILECENVLMAFHYTKDGHIAERVDGDEWYGFNRFVFYVIESEGKLYIKYFNLRDIAGGFKTVAQQIATQKFTNIPVYMQNDYGRKTPEYKEKLKECCKIVELDKSEFYTKVNAIKEVDFSKSYLDFFGYRKAIERLNYYDYINRNIFYSDEYCLIEYKPCIELFDYVLEKCNILHMTKTEFKFFEKKDREGIMKKLVDLEIESLMSIE